MSSASSAQGDSARRRIHLVRGYHRASYPPEVAYEEKLRARFAVIVDPFVRRSEDDFDSELFFGLVSAIFDQIAHDRLVFEYREFLTQRSRLLDHLRGAGFFRPPPVRHVQKELEGDGNSTPLDQLREHYSRLDEDDQDAPWTITLMKDDVPVCTMETEFWCRCGGPLPYSDSYTYAFYTERDRFDELRAACESACATLRTEIGEVYVQSGEKEPFGRFPNRWWRRRLLRRLGLIRSRRRA